MFPKFCVSEKILLLVLFEKGGSGFEKGIKKANWVNSLLGKAAWHPSKYWLLLHLTHSATASMSTELNPRKYSNHLQMPAWTEQWMLFLLEWNDNLWKSSRLRSMGRETYILAGDSPLRSACSLGHKESHPDCSMEVVTHLLVHHVSVCQREHAIR